MSLKGRPGSLPWLIHHELRLAWRGIGGKGIALMVVLLLILSGSLHLAAYKLLAGLPAGEMPDFGVFAGGLALWVIVTLMLSQAILMSVTALFDRGDLDLLLSSPLPTRHVFVARGLGIAVSVLPLYLLLLSSVANVGVFTGHPQLLGIYPTLLALALGVTALGLWLTLLLVRMLGARRARTVAQVLGSLVGAIAFLGFQAPNILSREAKARLMGRLTGWLAPDGPLSIDSPVWYPARALLGEGLPLLATVLVGAGSFWLVVSLTHRHFLAGTQESVSGSERRGQPAPAAGSVRFRTGLSRSMLLKEWRLILRDPQLITQTLLQLMYMLPMLFLALRGEGQLAQVFMIPAMVWLATALAANLAWITVAAEDAPDLLGCAPTSLIRLRWLKVLAALLPVWLLVLPYQIYLMGQGGWQALVLLVCLLGGTVSVGAGQVWYPRQAKRGDMKKRMQGMQAVGWLELLVTLGWVGVAYCLQAALAYAPLALLAVLVGTGGTWWLGRSKRGEL
ncbi:hypothetical protein [Pelomonas sp. SE-A7]|uniref:hypothetical protein n=1 Tax=Pelomonas sp. SE-A7 TaxID=3054953 RepID=UPI00259C6C44|nr:hypothetical protein [Pelomonas sp. SE-A7]MDM4767748.1 hypothetical protein [Pelomonas sp. SE-A7]